MERESRKWDLPDMPASFFGWQEGAIREKTSLYGTILNGLQDVFGRICGTGQYAMKKKKMFFQPDEKSFG